MSKLLKSITLIITLLFLTNIAFAQSGREYRRSSIMRGNLVKSVFGNWGVIGQPAQKGSRGAWIYDNNGYIGDVSPLVGAEVKVGNQTFHSVVVSPVDRPTKQHELSPSGKYWGFEPVSGYFNENQQGIALYSDPFSWPPLWPDKLTDPEDPGWSGSWNGFFGKTTTATDECFFVMDDNNDEEFNFAANNRWGVDFKPDANNPARNGLGLEVKVRAMQWSDFLAQDCIFWLYEITNTSTTDYSKVTFGMLVGTLIGTSGSESYNEYDDDYSFFDVEKDLTYTADYDDNARRNPQWKGDVGVVGYAFLESPGNQYDGIDNDGDADANPLFPPTGQFFTVDDFGETSYNTGDQVVLIDDQYNRFLATVPENDTTFATRGQQITISPGITKLVEGNIVIRDGKETVNPNAYDGVDNDLDGLIDENYYLHYRQIRKDTKGNILIDKLNPVRYKNYRTGLGVNDPMIDERRDDGIDNDGDWNPEFDDVGADGILGTNDRGEGDGEPTLGEPNFDQTDVDESDQIGLTSFEYFTPANDFSMADDEDLWRRLSPGYFEVPESIVNNKPQRGEDGDFFYGSGYFPLRAGETQRFSLALVYGEGGGPNVEIEDLLNNRETVQKIYDSDYRFPPAPNKPTLTVVPGDGEVTLYWDRKAEQTLDPVLKINDFEGYKIYKATDQNFNEVFSITDADGTPISYRPMQQYDLTNGIKGYFRASNDLYQQSRGASFYLGNDTGLKHSFVDTDVQNGRRYFYAVVAYDRGNEETDIFPKENDKRIDILPTGEVRTFQNTAVVVPNAPVVGYVPPEGSVQLINSASIGTGKIYYHVVNDEALTGHNYLLEFFDTGTDGIDNNNNWNVLTDDVGTDGIANSNDPDGTETNGQPDPGEPNLDQNDSEELLVTITTLYSIKDLTGVTATFKARDTVYVKLPHKHQVDETVVVTDQTGQEISPSNYILNSETGKIRGAQSGDLRYGETYTISYQYYPVYRSPYIERSKWVTETLDTDIFDGIELSFNNNWNIEYDTLKSYWSNPNKAMDYTFSNLDTYLDTDRLLGLRHPADYQIIFYDTIVDTSADLPQYFVTGIPINFQLINSTDNRPVEFIFGDYDGNSKLTSSDELIFLEPGANDEPTFTWDVYFPKIDTVFDYVSGDTLTIKLKKPFRQGDGFQFTAPVPTVEHASPQAQLDMIKVVPNPYIVATAHELPLPPAISSGRGERKIDFIHLPPGAEIHLFTARGEHVITLQHDSSIFDGTVAWNLKTKENLDVAPGIYFYVVKSSIGSKEGKIAVIK